MAVLTDFSRVSEDQASKWTLEQVNNEMKGRLEACEKVLEDAGETFDISADDAKALGEVNSDLTVLGKRKDSLIQLAGTRDEVRESLRKMREPQRDLPFQSQHQGSVQTRESPVPRATFGHLFIESDAFKGYQRSKRQGPESEIKGADAIASMFGYKALLETTDYPIAPQTLPGIQVPYLFRRLVVADLIPQAGTTSPSIEYVEEGTPTNGADFVAEGGLKPESTLTFTQKTATVRKIATLLAVTDEMLADVPQIRGYIDGRLRLFVGLREETALLSGTGVAPEFFGLLNTVGIQTAAQGADNLPDAIYKMMTNIQLNSFLDPSGIIMNPLDWQKIALLKTPGGEYIWGGPVQASGPERVWGLPVVKTVAISAGTALVGAFDTATQIFRREGITISVSDSHNDFFQRNQLAIRCEERLGLVVYRPAGLGTITAIA